MNILPVVKARAYIPAILMSFIFLLCEQGLAAAESRWALLVGIDQYQREDITPLKGAVADVRAVASALEHYCGFSADKLFMLTSDDPANRPDLGNILVKLEFIASQAKPGDVFLFYFSGHGVSQGEKSYLLPWGADRRNAMLLERTSIPVDMLRDYLAKVSADKIVVVLDACRNNPEAGRGDTDNPLGGEFARGIVRIMPTAGEARSSRFSSVIFSCGIGQRAYEWPGRGRGFFSLAFEEAVSGKAAGEDGAVNLNRLESYLDRRVPEMVAQVLGPEKVQVPWVDRSGAGAGEFLWSIFEVRPSGVDKVPHPGLQPVKPGELPVLPMVPFEPVKVDSNPPEVRFTTTPKSELNLLEAKRVEFRFAGTDDVGLAGYKYRLDANAEVETKRSFIILENLPSGVHTLQVQASDAQGNYSLPAMYSFTVLGNRPPEVKIESPAEGSRVRYVKVSVSLSGSDVDGQVTTWRCGLDSPDRMTEQGGPVFVFEDLVDGPHTVFAQVVDDVGTVSEINKAQFYFIYEELNSIVPGLRMVVIPGGSFMMGSNSGPDDEKPVHRVTVSSFEMSAMEITQVQWRAFMGNNPWWYHNKGDDLPVENVSWDDAIEFCRKLNELTGQRFDLPTEAEWEYACRAGTSTNYYSGDSESDLDRVGWYYRNSGKTTHPVGQKQANAFGLYDMHGNVWEWCSDLYGRYGGGELAWKGVGIGFDRVLRGGGWANDANYCRSASRNDPLSGSHPVGVRLVRR